MSASATPARSSLSPYLERLILGGAPDGEGALLFEGAIASIIAHTPVETPAALQALDQAVASGCSIAGYVSYEALDGAGTGAAALPQADPRLAADSPAPLLCFGVFEAPRRLSAADFRARFHGGDYTLQEDLAQRLAFERPFLESVGAVREYLAAGESYQINLTGRLSFEFGGNCAALYTRLFQLQPAAYAAFIESADVAILSLSPELFFELERDADGWCIRSRPMKGTFPRAGVQALAAPEDQKSLAENRMIVDVLRNDLGICAIPGSVRVRDAMALEALGPLRQSTTTVEALLSEETRGRLFEKVLPAIFPCASVTGAPRLAARQRIRRLEDHARGLYTGAIGYATPQSARFNVAIRTVVVDRRQSRADFGLGAGIVWDSTAADELRECQLKAAFVRMADSSFALIETMRASHGRIALLVDHLARLQRSAAELRFVFPGAKIEADLRNAARAAAAGTPGEARLRLLLFANGRIEIETTALASRQPKGAGRPRRLCLANETIWSADPFRRWKSTQRGEYSRGLEQARAAGFDDALFLNERGEIVETAIANLLIHSVDGRWLSPAIESGALGGVWLRRFERYLGRRGKLLHRVTLSLSEAQAAGRWYVCNAVRGIESATLSVSG